MQLDKYSGRITYREMAYLILEHMTEEQKDCDITAIDPLEPLFVYNGDDGSTNESVGEVIALNLVLPTDEALADLGLDDNHPVFIALEIGE